MSTDSRTPSESTRTLRRLGGLQLLTALGIASFWVYFFAVENRRPGNDPIYLAFERSFPVPDLLWLAPLLVFGGWSMRRGRPAAVPCSIAAGGAMVFLGLVDAAFNVQQARYTLSLFDGVLNGFINLYCVIVGLMLVRYAWRFRNGSLAVSGADRAEDSAAPDPDPRSGPPGRKPGSQASRARRFAKSLAGQYVTITGGSSGIGLSTAKKLAADGAHVTILARNRDRLDLAASAIDAVKHASALPCLALTCDVADADQVARAFESMARAGRQPEILINSAGVSEPGYFMRQPLDAFERQMRINYFGTLHTIRQAVPAMIDRGGGHIVNLSSVAGFLGIFGYAGYAATKFAVWGLSEVLRGELRGHGIAVSVVCPPDTDTPQLRDENKTKPLETKAIAGSVKPLTAEQVADAIIQGIARRRFHILPALATRLFPPVLGLARPLVHRILDRKVEKKGSGYFSAPGPRITTVSLGAGHAGDAGPRPLGRQKSSLTPFPEILLVTGGTGFIGGRLVRRLLADGHRVRALCLPDDPGAQALVALGAAVVTGDVADRAAVADAVAGVSRVFHCAGVVTDWAPRAAFDRVHVDGMANLLRAAIGQQVERFCWISTNDVFGPREGRIINERDDLRRWSEPYPDTKIAAERLAWRAYGRWHLPVTTVYPCWVYGPGDTTFIPLLADAIVRRQVVFWRRDALVWPAYVDNVVDLLVRVGWDDAAVGQGYLVHDGICMTFQEFSRRIAEHLHVRPPRLHIPYGAAYAAAAVIELAWALFRIPSRPLLTTYTVTNLGSRLRYSIEKARVELGWTPPIGFEDAFAETMEKGVRLLFSAGSVHHKPLAWRRACW